MLHSLSMPLIVAAYLISTIASHSQEATTDRTRPSLVVNLEGGVASKNFVQVLDTLEKEKLPLQTVIVPVQAKAKICDLLKETRFPPPCGDFLPYIGRLNPNVNLNVLANVSSLVFPDISITIVPTERVFTRTANLEESLDKLVDNWSPINAKILQRRSTEILVSYERYSAQLFMDPNVVMQAARLVANQKIKNLTVQVKGVPLGVAKSFGDSEDDNDDTKNARSDCESDNWLHRLRAAARKYINWFDRDVAADEFAIETVVDPLRRVKIHVMDTPIPLKMPNLDRGYVWKWPAAFRCQWLYDKDKHHGNHLASIIGSLNNGTGFFGLAPGASIESFDVRDPTISSGDIADHLERSKRANPLTIYLFATGLKFKHLVGDPNNGSWQIEQLQDKATRYSDPIASVVSQSRPLMVVAAGQKEFAGESTELSALTNYIPQNLGDHPNVIVVTACRVCRRGSVQLMKGAYKSEAAAKFVHVAAPGGAPIPAWTSETSMGAAAGTSQAAAYVAGIAASMLSHYPETYREPAALKYRLQMCSYPIQVATPERTPNLERNGLSAGVVDPAVCLLDPTKTWIKNNDGKWMAVAMKGWTDQTQFLKSGKKPFKDLSNDSILRVVRTGEQAPGARLALYINRKDQIDSDSEVERGLGQVMTIRAASHSSQAGLLLCSGATLPLAELDDVIVASEQTPCQREITSVSGFLMGEKR